MMSVKRPVFKHKLRVSFFKATLLAVGISLVSIQSVSASDLIQNKVILPFSDKEDVEVNSDWLNLKSTNDDVVSHASNPRAGEVLLDLNRHSRVAILPQNNEVQFLDQAERKSLLTLLSHLQQSDALIQRSQAYQRPDQRIKFRYDWLRQDIHKMNRSILDHLNSPENQTRFFEPLNDDYRR